MFWLVSKRAATVCSAFYSLWETVVQFAIFHPLTFNLIKASLFPSWGFLYTLIALMRNRDLGRKQARSPRWKLLFFTIRCQPPRESYFCLASSSIGPFCLVLKQLSSIAGLMLQYLHQHVAKALCFDGPSGNQKQMMWFNPHRYNTVAVSFRLDVYSASVWSFCRFWPLNCIRMCCFSRQTLDFFPWAVRALQILSCITDLCSDA